VQGIHHGGDLQAGHPVSGGLGQQPLGGQAEVAGRARGGRHLVGAGAGGGGDRADRELLGQAQVHPGELRRDQALAQVTDRGQQLGRGRRHQRGETVDQRQPGAGLLQVAVGLGDDLILHGAPFALPDHDTPVSRSPVASRDEPGRTSAAR